MMRNDVFTGMFILGLFLTGLLYRTDAQEMSPDYIRHAVSAVETMLTSDKAAAIDTFIDEDMIPGKVADRAAFARRLQVLRSAVHGLFDDISIEAEPDGVRMILSDGMVEKQIKIEIAQQGISDIYLLPPEKPMILNRDNLTETFDSLEAAGVAGVVYVRLHGNVILKRAFGMANKELEIPNTLNTVFGTGSRPIDYMVAAIMLLDQQGYIRLDDPVDKYFHDVPQDKQTLTIRHLMTGQSGLLPYKRGLGP
ncbi:MAG: beta-lactamase family protein [Bacteroidales bacterium]|nr:beta-lactamase family protein [Bacteroidales bacterium]